MVNHLSCKQHFVVGLARVFSLELRLARLLSILKLLLLGCLFSLVLAELLVLFLIQCGPALSVHESVVHAQKLLCVWLELNHLLNTD